MGIVLMDDDPLLRTRSDEVTEFDDTLIALADAMMLVVTERRALGLAAVQVGIPKRVLVVNTPDRTLCMVNPVVIRHLRREDVKREGCLSVPPRHWGEVSRPAKCEVKWQGLLGSFEEEGFSGLMARVIQHEIDHLDGVLMTDRMLGQGRPA